MSQIPSVHSDDAWKEKAQREKDSLAGKAPEAAPVKNAAPAPEPAPAANPAPAPSARQLPPASFSIILEMFAMQAMVCLGTMPDPATGKPQKDLPLARHFIDLITVLSDTSKGNLKADEQSMLDATLYQLRMHYVNAAKK